MNKLVVSAFILALCLAASTALSQEIPSLDTQTDSPQGISDLLSKLPTPSNVFTDSKYTIGLGFGGFTYGISLRYTLKEGLWAQGIVGSNGAAPYSNTLGVDVSIGRAMTEFYDSEIMTLATYIGGGLSVGGAEQNDFYSYYYSNSGGDKVIDYGLYAVGGVGMELKVLPIEIMWDLRPGLYNDLVKRGFGIRMGVNARWIF